MVLFHGMASRHIVPLSSMVFHNPWYCPKAHCNNVIKMLYAFSIKHSSIFRILHSSYSIELLGYWFWVLFLVWFERRGSNNPSWASPIHVAYLLYVSLCYFMHTLITICRFSLLLSQHTSLLGFIPQDLDQWYQRRYALHGNESLSIVQVQRSTGTSNLILALLESICWSIHWFLCCIWIFHISTTVDVALKTLGNLHSSIYEGWPTSSNFREMLWSIQYVPMGIP